MAPDKNEIKRIDGSSSSTTSKLGSTALFSDDDFVPSDEELAAPQKEAPLKTNQPKPSTGHRLSRLVHLLVGIVVLLLLGLAAYIIHRQTTGHRGKSGTPISLSEIEAHNAPDDCWMAIHGDVFDLTQYAPNHPGGPKYIWAYCGMDATEPYADEHPKKLLDTIPQYEIGFVSATLDELAPSNPAPAPQDSEEEEDDSEEEEDDPVVTVPDSPPPPPPPANCISMATVQLNNDAASCHQVLYGDVYDFTQYADLHPGDPEPIWENCGTDATTVYQNEKKHDQDLLAKHGSEYFLMPLCTGEQQQPGPTPSVTQPSPAPDSNCIPLDTVYLNDNAQSCYMILYDTVYDFTAYANLHPGDPEPIWQNCGLDATVDYEREKKHDETLLEKHGPDYLLGPACVPP